MPYDPETGDWVDAAPQQQGQEQRTNAEWKELRLAQTAAKRLEKENAFLKAGINPEASKMAEYFAKGYDGDLSVEAIKAAAAEAGILQVQPGPQQEQPPAAPASEGGDLAALIAEQQQQELAAQGRVASASTGATPPPVDPSTLIQQAFQQGGQRGLLDALANSGVPIAYEGVVQE